MQKFQRAFQKIFLLTLFVLAAMTTSACSDDGATKGSNNGVATKSATANFSDTYNANDTWVIQLYLCGSDLETRIGSATMDIQEIMEVKLPPNVKFVIETGGAAQWQNDVVSNGAIERYLYDSEGLQRLAQLPDADMGDVNTLTDFIRFGKENFQADHRIFILWDHGGGSLNGICFDERTNHALSLNELTQAFGAVYGSSTENPPFEIIGFDACLMATYDTLSSLEGFARYVVASEETEPALGWNYTGWLGAFANNTAMGGAKIGKEICDSYLSACKNYGMADTITLSVTDMSKLPDLRDAYENFGLEALVNAYQSPQKFFSTYGRGANNSENYGGNNKSDGYSDMVDLADLARNNKEILPQTSDGLINAIDSAVIYKVNGDYRDKGGGVSSFHSYNGKSRDGEAYLLAYLNLEAAPEPQKLLYYYLMYGELPDEVKPVLDQLAKDPNAFAKPEQPAPIVEQPTPTTAPTQQTNLFDITALEDTPVNIDADGNSFVTLTQQQMDLLSSVHCQLMYMSLEDDVIIHLGLDSDINANWDTGVFTDNFRGVWPMLDGHPVFVEITAENDGYNLYSIPIKLNGVECSLQVAYVFAAKEYYILGARRGIDAQGMSDRELIKLRPGDEITTIHYGTTLSSEIGSDIPAVEGDTFTIGEHPQVKDEQLPDGTYAYCFEFVAPTEESSLSNVVVFTVAGGQITTSVNN